MIPVTARAEAEEASSEVVAEAEEGAREWKRLGGRWLAVEQRHEVVIRLAAVSLEATPRRSHRENPEWESEKTRTCRLARGIVCVDLFMFENRQSNREIVMGPISQVNSHKKPQCGKRNSGTILE